MEHRSGLVWGVVGGLVYGLLVRLVDVLRSTTPILQSTEYDQAVNRSRASLLFTIGRWSLIGPLLFGSPLGASVGLVFGVTVGVVLGMDEGGAYLALQSLERRRLRRAGILPDSPQEAFDWGVEQGLMRRVGGCYQFRRNYVRDAFAALDPNLITPDRAEVAR